MYVSLPNSMHHEWTLKAIEAGKHVLVEKPMAPTLSDARAMVAAAERANRLLMVSQNYRFYPAPATASAAASPPPRPAPRWAPRMPLRRCAPRTRSPPPTCTGACSPGRSTP